MNVKELKEMLSKYPDDMEVIHGMYSDYEKVEESDWSLEEAVDQGVYVMRAHRTMSVPNIEKKRTYLALRGN